MTFDEALAKLGLSRGASPDQARRAYLQLLKKTRPEVDRDEFIALRDAYEVVRGLIPLMAHVEAASGATVNPSPSRANVEELTPVVEGAAPADPIQPAAGSARTAEELHHVVLVAPPFANVTEIDNGARAAARPDRVLPPAEAARRMCDLFDRAGHDPNTILPVVESLRLALACLASGEVTPAFALSEKVTAWIQRSGRETALHPEVLTTWITVRELAAVAPVVPPRVFTPIAEAALQGELEGASGALKDYRIERPQAALLALDQMKHKAPWLAVIVGGSLAKPPKRRRTFNLRWAGAPAPVIIYIALRVLAWFAATPKRNHQEWTPPPAQQAWISPQPVEIPMQTDAGSTERLKRALGLFFQLSESVAETMRSCQMARAETLVTQVKEHVRKGDCAYAGAPMAQLRELKAAYPPQEWACASEQVQALDRSFTLVCKEAEKILPPRKPQ